MHENDFYVGIDIGQYSATASYLDQHSGKPVIIDRTGGFGQVYIKTAMMYAEDEAEWFIGDDATHDPYADSIVIENVLDMVLSNKAVTIDGKNYSGIELLSIFVRETVDFIYQINPKAELKGLCLTLIDEVYFAHYIEIEKYFREDAFKTVPSVYIRPSSETMLTYLSNYELFEEDSALLFDYGHSGFRVYSIEKKDEFHINLELSTEKLSGSKLISAIEGILESEYLNHLDRDTLTDDETHKLIKLATTYYPYVFKSHKSKKPLKIPYSFAFPPFQGVLTSEVIDSVVEPFEATYDNVVKKLVKRSSEQTVIVTGNGFRMGWPMERLRQQGAKLVIEDTDGIAKGAAIYAYEPVETSTFQHAGVLSDIYGFVMGDGSFMPVVKKGHHYQQAIQPIKLTMTQKDKNTIALYKENSEGERTVCMYKEIFPPKDESIYIVSVTMSFDEALIPELKVSYNPL